MNKESINWQCPNCKQYSKKEFKFENIGFVTEKDLRDKKKKARYFCRICLKKFNSKQIFPNLLS